MRKSICVLCPSGSMHYVTAPVRKIAVDKLESYGYQVKFGKYIDDTELGDRASIQKRVEDLHTALNDPDVTFIMAGVGGFHVAEILDHIDYKLVKEMAKPLIGFSDITTLQNSIFTKTGNISYSGPNFSSFGMKKGGDYIAEHFIKNIKDSALNYVHSNVWSDDTWYFDQDDRDFIENVGPIIIKDGITEGILVGGNLSSLALLQGTEYMPDLNGSILIAEEDAVSGQDSLNVFIRQLRSLIFSSGTPRAILIGRFQKSSIINIEELRENILVNFGGLDIPIIANLDFGHTAPTYTFPIGAKAFVKADYKNQDYQIAISK